MLPLRLVRAIVITAIFAAASIGCASTATGPSTASITTTAAHSSASSAPTFTGFAGQWYGHGSLLVIHQDGSFTMLARTYRTCGQDPPPCDTFSGNAITAGDRASGRLTSVSGEVATGTVTKTTDSADNPTGPITMTLDLANDTISARNVSFCGPNAPAGTCGA